MFVHNTGLFKKHGAKVSDFGSKVPLNLVMLSYNSISTSKF